MPTYLCPMEQHDPVPVGCFSMEEVERFRALEGSILSDVNYYLWLETEPAPDARAYRFLYALELLFESGEALLLCSGDDSEAICCISPEALVKTALRLQKIHGRPTIQRLSRRGQGLWFAAMSRPLEAVRLARRDDGLYHNDALLLDFGGAAISVELPGMGEGLEIREM